MKNPDGYEIEDLGDAMLLDAGDIDGAQLFTPTGAIALAADLLRWVVSSPASSAEELGRATSALVHLPPPP